MMEVSITPELSYIRLGNQEYRTFTRPNIEPEWQDQKPYVNLLYQESAIAGKTLHDWFDGRFNWTLTDNQITEVRRFAEAFNPKDAIEWPTQEMRVVAVRHQRDQLMFEAISVLDRHDKQTKYGISAALSEEAALRWARYLQDLRDVPEQPNFPDKVCWPEKPQGE